MKPTKPKGPRLIHHTQARSATRNYLPVLPRTFDVEYTLSRLAASIEYVIDRDHPPYNQQYQQWRIQFIIERVLLYQYIFYKRKVPE